MCVQVLVVVLMFVKMCLFVSVRLRCYTCLPLNVNLWLKRHSCCEMNLFLLSLFMFGPPEVQRKRLCDCDKVLLKGRQHNREAASWLVC